MEWILALQSPLHKVAQEAAYQQTGVRIGDFEMGKVIHWKVKRLAQKLAVFGIQSLKVTLE